MKYYLRYMFGIGIVIMIKSGGLDFFTAKSFVYLGIVLVSLGALGWSSGTSLRLSWRGGLSRCARMERQMTDKEIKTILTDLRTIDYLVFPGEDNEAYFRSSGYKIFPYAEPGQSGFVPWLAIYRNNELQQRINAALVQTIVYAPSRPQSATQNTHGVSEQGGAGKSGKTAKESGSVGE